jgi:hypothetical protein
MIVDLIRQNAIAALLGMGAGFGVGGTVVYVVVSPPASIATQSTADNAKPAEESASQAPQIFPSRFIIDRGDGARDFCDLTITPDARCYSMGLRIKVQRHASDPTRVVIEGFGTRYTGVTWDRAVKGLKLGPQMEDIMDKPFGFKKENLKPLSPEYHVTLHPAKS